jgi:pimeloyl-ACP methyl ester carboxylesterase
MHVLEAGDPSAPGLLLLHGFPELAYSWRKVIVPLAAAGYHVMAPDQRGFGRTTGWDAAYDGDLSTFSGFNLARDALDLARALGHETVDLAGHDFGSLLGAFCALLRPDVFRSVALMSAPFGGLRRIEAGSTEKLLADLAALPRPRNHYQAYYCTREANRDMLEAPQGLHAFLRGYFHVKSAD